MNKLARKEARARLEASYQNIGETILTVCQLNASRQFIMRRVERLLKIQQLLAAELRAFPENDSFRDNLPKADHEELMEEISKAGNHAERALKILERFDRADAKALIDDIAHAELLLGEVFDRNC
jgi:hypothetical protein